MRSVDTSREAIVRLLAGLMKEESTMDAIREPGASTLLSNATVDRVRAGLRAAYAVIDAITAERDQLRAEVQAERTAREQAEARVRELEAERDALRDGKPTPGWRKRVPNLNVTGASGS